MKRSNNINLAKLKREVKGLKGDNGRPLCCFCREEVPAGRRSWCSAECVHDYRMLNDWNYVTSQVWKRDKGICADCGIDTDKLRYKVRRVLNWVRLRNRQHNHKFSFRAIESLYRERYSLKSRLHGSQWWDAHHIVPLSRGGGIGLDNLVTLCVECHKRRHAGKAQRHHARMQEAYLS